jgi:hypothetical protein
MDPADDHIFFERLAIGDFFGWLRLSAVPLAAMDLSTTATLRA